MDNQNIELLINEKIATLLLVISMNQKLTTMSLMASWHEVTHPVFTVFKKKIEVRVRLG